MIKQVIYLFSLLLVIGLYSCNRQANVQHEEHESEAIMITAYSDHYELFMEFDPLIVGDTSEFIIHITRLSDYKPLLTKSVIFEISGVDNYREVLEKPDRPGIYLTSYIPEKAAEKAKIIISFQDSNIKDQFVIDDQEIFESEAAIEEHEHEHNHGKEGDISFLKEQAWETDFGVSQARNMAIADILKVSGKLQSLPTANNNLVASSSGILEFSRDNMLPGQKVKKGDPLFYIKPGGLAGQNIKTRYIRAKTDFEKAETDFRRAQKLVADQIISRREFAGLKARYENARADFESISRNFQDNGQVITSPIDGVISMVEMENGSFVSQGDILAKILNTEQLVLKADLPQNNINALSQLQSANFRTAGHNRLYNTDSLGGKLLSTTESTIIENYYLPVFFKIENPGRLIPGTYAEIFLKFIKDDKALLIPQTAIMEQEGNHYVFVQVSGESFRRQDVTTGRSDGRMVEISSGLHPGDWVVSKGAYRVKLASMSGELPSHGHAH
ncbi:MAG: efflux RND transporter periplasmic adaptor subunit [Bacteroidales bacterium]|nr:efflux RND transporter periplasmic adaptor subunit [Bacteroidales bacterium]MCF8351072.1 efflux RND transporter periplasmic adaptor subunit [Bacteroidales bacterium]MCF8377386.1 efflux RND transporter periplasmic adaptor subunit [Bacteroidales bacterium]MCF8401335.1 efflux RND transporter periplasmic adaptor subunit [Bacteroidales bacterium]